MNGAIKKILLLSLLLFSSNAVYAGGFFETGVVTLDDTVDGAAGWESVTLTKTFVNPVVVAGPITDNNTHSLFPRIRNVTPTGFEIGMQSPCESYATYTGPRAVDPPEQAVCPPALGWVSEEVSYWVMEEGVWEFPNGTEIEAFEELNVNAIRSGVGADTRIVVDLNHTYAGNDLVVFHSPTGGGGNFIYSLATRFNSFTTPPNAGDGSFGLSLEGMEFTAAHGAENISWIAMLPDADSNAGLAYNVGRTGITIDRHEDGCFNIAAGAPVMISQPLTMTGGNGSGVGLCGAAGDFDVHMDEDQVGDGERTGITEAVSYFTHPGGSGALDFLTATLTVVDENAGTVLPGDFLTYSVNITNRLDDFAQANNAGNELEISLDSNVTFDSVTSVGSGALAHNSGTMEWNGTIPADGTVLMLYRVQVNDDVCGAGGMISSQGTLFMDANGDNGNDIEEVTDDPTDDDSDDSDWDVLTNDDDPTEIEIDCTADLQIRKGDPLTTYTPGGTSTYTIQVRNGGPARVTGATIADDLPNGVTMTGNWTCTPSSVNSSCNTAPDNTDPISIDVDLAVGDFVTITVPVQYSSNMGDY